MPDVKAILLFSIWLNRWKQSWVQRVIGESFGDKAKSVYNMHYGNRADKPRTRYTKPCWISKITWREQRLHNLWGRCRRNSVGVSSCRSRERGHGNVLWRTNNWCYGVGLAFLFAIFPRLASEAKSPQSWKLTLWFEYFVVLLTYTAT